MGSLDSRSGEWEQSWDVGERRMVVVRGIGYAHRQTGKWNDIIETHTRRHAHAHAHAHKLKHKQKHKRKYKHAKKQTHRDQKEKIVTEMGNTNETSTRNMRQNDRDRRT